MYEWPPRCFSTHVPHAVATAWSSSASKGNPRWYFSSNASCFFGSSGEIPTTSSPMPASSCRWSRRSHDWTVHPGVSASG